MLNTGVGQSMIPWNEPAGSIVYTSISNTGSQSEKIQHAARYSMGLKEAAQSNGVYLAEDEKLTFDFTAVPFEPKPRDRVTPDGLNSRVVLSVTRNPFLRFWDLVVRDLQIAYRLQDLCTIKRPTALAGGGGLRSATYDTILEDAPCRLQPESMSVEMEVAGRVTSRLAYTLFLDSSLQLLAGDTVTVDDVVYEVLSQSDTSQFDSLASVKVSRLA